MGAVDDKIVNALQGKNALGRVFEDPGQKADKILEGMVALALRDHLVDMGRTVSNSQVPFQKHFLLTKLPFAEVDTDLHKFVVEVTNGTSSKASQVREKYSHPIVNPNAKPVLVYAPNFRPGQVNGAIKAGAAGVFKNWDDLVRYVDTTR